MAKTPKKSLAERHLDLHRRIVNDMAPGIAGRLLERAEIEPTPYQAEQAARSVSPGLTLREVSELVCERLALGRSTDQHDNARAAVSSGAVGKIFEQAIAGAMADGLDRAAAEDTTRDWTDELDLPNFRPHDLVLGGLDETPRAHGGEASHATLRADDSEPIQLRRYQRQLQIDEMDILDDRLGMLTEVPRKVAMTLRRVRPDRVYSILMANPTMRDGNPLISSAHNNDHNLSLNADNLETVAAAMTTQKRDGLNVNLRPSHLLVAPSLRRTAQKELRKLELARQDVTPRLVTDARLENSFTDSLTGNTYTGSNSTWFLIAANGRTITAGYRAGTNRSIRSRTWNQTLGGPAVGALFDLDFDASAIDWLAIHRGNT